MTYQTPPATRVGHIHLKVSELDRSIAFYRDILGFEVKQKIGQQAAFLAAGDYHHHIGLNTWDSAGGPRPAPGTTGLFHVAFLYPDRKSLGAALKQVVEAGVFITGAADHGVSEAVYFEDPDGNGIELYLDTDPKTWPRDEDGNLAMFNGPLNLEALIAEAD